MKKVLSILMGIIMSVMILGINPTELKANLVPGDFSVKYDSQIENIGWQNAWPQNGSTSGTSGRGLRLEALKVQLVGAPAGVRVEYSTHSQNKGWMNPVYDGDISGTIGEGLRAEAFKIKLVNAPSDYHVAYRAHVENLGWMDWKYDGDIAGTAGRGLRVEAVEIKILKDSVTLPNNGVDATVDTHINGIGWTGEVGEAVTSGRPGSNRKLEGMKITAKNLPAGNTLKYAVHQENFGWLAPVTSGQVAGVVGKNLRTEALKVWIEGNQGLSVQYRAYIEGAGWTSWVKNGEIVGTTGMGKRIEAIQVNIDNNLTDLKPKANVTMHGFNTGKYPQTGEFIQVLQTSGRFNGMSVSLGDQASNMGIQYQTHIQNVGWTGWSSNGQISGETGKNLKLEAVKIKLTGSVGNYHLFYRTKIEGEGWQGWTRDGKISGTSGQNKAIVGLEMAIINTASPDLFSKKRVAIDIGHNVAYDSGAVGYLKEDNMTYETGKLVVNKLRASGYTVIETLPSTARSTRHSLEQRTGMANQNEADEFYSIHYNSAVPQAYGTEVYYYNGSNQSKNMASKVLGEIVGLGYYNRGVKTNDFYVIKNTNMPAVLIEGCFLSNSGDVNRYNKNTMADAIYRGIIK